MLRAPLVDCAAVANSLRAFLSFEVVGRVVAGCMTTLPMSFTRVRHFKIQSYVIFGICRRAKCKDSTNTRVNIQHAHIDQECEQDCGREGERERYRVHTRVNFKQISLFIKRNK